MLAGCLVSLNWRYTFAIYLLGLAVLVLVVLFLPAARFSRSGAGMDRQMLRTIMPYCLAMFTLMVAFYTVPSSFAIIVAQTGLVQTSLIGLVIAVQNITAFLAGMALSFLLKKLDGSTQYFGAGMLVIAFFCLSFTANIVVTILGLVALGMGMGTVPPILNAQLALRMEREKIAAAMALMSAMLYLGQFLSPIIVDGIRSVLRLQAVQTPYYIAMALAAILLVSFFRIPVSTAKGD